MPTFEVSATNLYGNSEAATVRVTYTQAKYSTYSIVQFTKIEVASHAASGYTFWPDGYIKVSDTTVCTCDQSAGVYIGEKNKYYTVSAKFGSVKVNHDADGTASMKAKFENRTSVWSGFFFANDNAGSLQFRVTNGTSKTVTLDSIGLASTLSCAGGTLGQEVTLNIITESTASAHVINYSCGNISGVAKLMTYERQIQWIPPIDLAESEPSGTSVSVTFTLETYVSGKLIGTNTEVASFLIPDDILPTATAEITDAKGYADIYGGYIQNQSALSIVLAADGAYGSTIRSQRISFDGKTYTAANVTTEVIKGSGELELVVTVKDSRGREASVTLEVPVLPYEPPKIGSLAVQRCNEDGTRNKSGTYLIATFDALITSLGEVNTASYKLQYKKSSASHYTEVALESLSGKFSVSGETYIFEADPNFSYNVVVVAEDAFATISKSANGLSKSVFWSRMAKGMGFAFGKICELKSHLDMGWHIYMNGNRIYGLPEPQEDDDAATKSYADSIWENIYPVGAIYLSALETSPEILFGGRWSRIEDRFLLAASQHGLPYKAGTTGGSTTVALSTDEIATHIHGMKVSSVGGLKLSTDGSTTYYPIMMDIDCDNDGIINEAGEGEPHDNMPPYLVVHMWQRTE